MLKGITPAASTKGERVCHMPMIQTNHVALLYLCPAVYFIKENKIKRHEGGGPASLLFIFYQTTK
jgi:hypothetical protein